MSNSIKPREILKTPGEIFSQIFAIFWKQNSSLNKLLKKTPDSFSTEVHKLINEGNRLRISNQKIIQSLRVFRNFITNKAEVELGENMTQLDNYLTVIDVVCKSLAD